MLTRPSVLIPRRRDLGQEIDGMGRHAEQIGCAGLDDAIEHARRIERRVHHEFTAADDRNGQADDADIVAHGAE